MPRQLRTFSNSNVYHIIIKGIDDSDIFYDDMDRNVFLEKVKLTKKEFKYKIYAYCLMSNHVHMVIEVSKDSLSKAIQSLTIRYVSYFNKKYDRKGPFVQNRFKSKNIENQRYFLEVCRYVHRNPEKAGIEKTNKYKWSSYKEYIGKEKIIDKKILLYYLNDDITEFIKYTTKTENIEEAMNLAEYELTTKLTDDEVINILLKKFELKSMEETIKYFKDKENKKKIKELKNIKMISRNQLSRIIRVDKKTISKIWNE